MQKKFYNCSYDLVFKAVFSDPKSIPILKELIKEVTGIDAKEINYLSGNVPKMNIYSKDRYVDLVVKTDKEVVNIEINNNNYLDTESMRIRNFSYLTSFYSNNIKNNEYYQKVDKHIQINYTFKNINGKLLEKYTVKNDNDETWIDNFEIYELNMDKLLKKYRINDILELDKFKYSLLLGLNKEELDKYTKGDKNMEEFNDKVNELNDSSNFVQFLTVEEDERKRINTGMLTSRNEGLEEGLEKGLKKGIKQGIKQGLEQGINKKNKEAAINFYNNGVSKDIIAKSLNITTEELNKILKNTTN